MACHEHGTLITGHDETSKSVFQKSAGREAGSLAQLKRHAVSESSDICLSEKCGNMPNAPFRVENGTNDARVGSFPKESA